MGKPKFLAAGLFAFLMSSFYSGLGLALEAWDDALESATAISVHGETLSVNLQEVPLNLVLEELARQANVNFVIPDGVGETLVSDTFKDVPLREGIRRLLKGHNYLLEYIPSSKGSGDRSLPLAMRIRVLEKRSGDSAQVTPGSPVQRTTAGRGDSSGYVASRVAELRDLATEDDKEKLKTALTGAISDANDEVRDTVLDILENMDTDAPPELLAGMALQDPNPEFRIRALDLLVESHPEAAQQPLERALSDGNTEVRDLASELLKDLKKKEKN